MVTDCAKTHAPEVLGMVPRWLGDWVACFCRSCLCQTASSAVPLLPHTSETFKPRCFGCSSENCLFHGNRLRVAPPSLILRVDTLYPRPRMHSWILQCNGRFSRISNRYTRTLGACIMQNVCHTAFRLRQS